MATRTQKIEPYKSGQTSTPTKQSEPPVNIHFHVSGTHNSGIEPDSLHAALGSKSNAYVPADMDTWTHGKASKSTGTHYNPTQDYRKVTPTGKEKKGSASNNALGKALNKVGQKSGYKSFKPKAGGKKP